jgi:hypothetical protein
LFSRWWVSAKFIPARETRTLTSPRPGTGSSMSTSRRTSGPPNAVCWMAFMDVPEAILAAP